MNTIWIRMGAAIFLVGATVLVLRGCMKDSRVEPLEASPFASCTFETLPDRRLIGEVYEMRAGTGTYAEIRIRKGAVVPEAFDGAAVQPFEKWPVSLWIYPLGMEMIDGYCAGTRRYPDASGKPSPAYLSKGGHYWGYQETGYKGLLPRPHDLPRDPDFIVCWTYVSTIPGRTGDLLYEVAVYPSAVPGEGGTRPRYGKREILRRGILRVLPTATVLPDSTAAPAD